MEACCVCDRLARRMLVGMTSEECTVVCLFECRLVIWMYRWKRFGEGEYGVVGGSWGHVIAFMMPWIRQYEYALYEEEIFLSNFRRFALWNMGNNHNTQNITKSWSCSCVATFMSFEMVIFPRIRYQ